MNAPSIGVGFDVWDDERLVHSHRNYTASSLRTMVRALGRLLPTPELAWSRGHETTVSKLDAV
jgi:hypothetical protein